MITINPKDLKRLYNVEKKSINQIAKILGYSNWTIRNIMIKSNIPRRSYHDNYRPNPKGNKRTWDVRSSDKEVRERKSNSLKGKFFHRKEIDYRPAVAVNCKNCGKIISRKYSQWENSKTKNFYCNKTCNKTFFLKNQIPHNKKTKIVARCVECNKVIERHESQFVAYGNHFCNPKCNGEWKAKNIVGDKVYNWKGGYDPYYGPNWKVQRKKCRERDNNTCQICHKTKVELGRNLDVDHKIPFEAFNLNWQEANRLENLISLCASCHTKKTNWQVTYGKITISKWRKILGSHLLYH